MITIRTALNHSWSSTNMATLQVCSDYVLMFPFLCYTPSISCCRRRDLTTRYSDKKLESGVT